MRARLVLIGVLVMGLLAAPFAWGQALSEKPLPGAATPVTPQNGSVRAPDPWYQQYYGPTAKDPRTLQTERAQFYSQQRQLRIASRAWYGISLSRPMATADIMFGDRLPRWTSGSVLRPYHWSFVPPAVTVVWPSEARADSTVR